MTDKSSSLYHDEENLNLKHTLTCNDSPAIQLSPQLFIEFTLLYYFEF